MLTEEFVIIEDVVNDIIAKPDESTTPPAAIRISALSGESIDAMCCDDDWLPESNNTDQELDQQERDYKEAADEDTKDVEDIEDVEDEGEILRNLFTAATPLHRRTGNKLIKALVTLSLGLILSERIATLPHQTETRSMPASHAYCSNPAVDWRSVLRTTATATNNSALATPSVVGLIAPPPTGVFGSHSLVHLPPPSPPSPLEVRIDLKLYAKIVLAYIHHTYILISHHPLTASLNNAVVQYKPLADHYIDTVGRGMDTVTKVVGANMEPYAAFVSEDLLPTLKEWAKEVQEEVTPAVAAASLKVQGAAQGACEWTRDSAAPWVGRTATATVVYATPVIKEGLRVVKDEVVPWVFEAIDSGVVAFDNGVVSGKETAGKKWRNVNEWVEKKKKKQAKKKQMQKPMKKLIKKSGAGKGVEGSCKAAKRAREAAPAEAVPEWVM